MSNPFPENLDVRPFNECMAANPDLAEMYRKGACAAGLVRVLCARLKESKQVNAEKDAKLNAREAMFTLMEETINALRDKLAEKDALLSDAMDALEYIYDWSMREGPLWGSDDDADSVRRVAKSVLARGKEAK